jgi:hypothetical protein
MNKNCWQSSASAANFVSQLRVCKLTAARAPPCIHRAIAIALRPTVIGRSMMRIFLLTTDRRHFLDLFIFGFDT